MLRRTVALLVACCLARKRPIKSSIWVRVWDSARFTLAYNKSTNTPNQTIKKHACSKASDTEELEVIN
jgi:hypothetical protein